MSRSVSPISGKSYGLAVVCRAWRLARSGVYRHRAPASSTPAQRRGPVGPMPDAALLAAIRAVLAASPFHGEGHRKVWARLRHGGYDLGHRSDDHDHRRGPGGSVRRHRSLLRRMCRHSCRCTSHPLSGAGTDPPRCAAALRRVRQGHRRRSRRPPRSRIAIHVRHLLDRDRLSRHQKFARFHPGTRRQWLRRALHPHPEREPVVGADLRNRRGAAPGPAALSGDLQFDLADRAARLHHPGSLSPAAASTRGTRRIGFNPVSQQPRAVQ